MIKYLKRSEIDIEKYNNCVEKSFNSRVFAFSWYLDIVADNWDVLVLNDYEAVMPLPWREKYFIKYVYPPAWTQQLGVFSSKNISEELIKRFIKHIPKKFKKITIQFNSENKFQHKKLTERVNYILTLNKSYEKIYRGFNSNRKRIIKKALHENFKISEDINSTLFFNFYTSVDKPFKVLENQKETLKNILLVNNNSVNIIAISNGNHLLTALLYLKDAKRITYLLPVATKEAKHLGLPTLLISYLLEKYQNTNLIFDFEGSMIKGVADFYKSFGSENESYIEITYNKPPKLISYFKK